MSKPTKDLAAAASQDFFDEDEDILTTEQKAECEALFLADENFRLAKTRLNVLTAILASKNSDENFRNYRWFPKYIMVGDEKLFGVYYSPYIWRKSLLDSGQIGDGFTAIERLQEESEANMMDNIFFTYDLKKDQVENYMKLLADGALREIKKIATVKNIFAVFTAAIIFDTSKEDKKRTSIDDYAKKSQDEALVNLLSEFAKTAERQRLQESLAFGIKVPRNEILQVMTKVQEAAGRHTPSPLGKFVEPGNSPYEIEAAKILAGLKHVNSDDTLSRC